MEKEITVIEARDIIKSGETLQLIDVRSQEAFEDYALPGFINIPLNRISQEIPNLDNRKKTLLICADGSQSTQAQKLLESCEINALVIRGGHIDWKKIISTPLK
ncbi:rhodanese-like domain-containing protein [bacterium]|nr:rhodanese-like domain-containing protein [bacterium]